MSNRVSPARLSKFHNEHQPMSSALDRQRQNAKERPSQASNPGEGVDPDIAAFIEMQTDMHVKGQMDMARSQLFGELNMYRDQLGVAPKRESVAEKEEDTSNNETVPEDDRIKDWENVYGP